MRKCDMESGRSMVEMLGVIAIIGVISVGGITSMSYIDSYFRTSATLLEIDQVARDISDMCSWATGYDTCGLSVDMLQQEEIIDSDKNRWGGTMNVEATVDEFKLTYTEVPETACEQMVEELTVGEGETKTQHLVELYATETDCPNGKIVFIGR
ncbi:MAG: hypothetical protein IJY58_00265 [Alphaproteobacteria bacterium]|nr:hypothetical protein [Alphaproteobacteria bacterium]